MKAGYHVYRSELEEKDFLGMKVVQIHLAEPRGYKILAKLDIPDCVERIYAHSGYFTSACFNPDKGKAKRAFALLKKEISTLTSYGERATGLVMHVTNAVHIHEDSWQQMADLASSSNIRILFEHTASKNNLTSIEEFAQFNDLMKSIRPDEDWYGFCIDSAHAFAQGHPLHKPGELIEWILSWTKEIPSPGVKLLHLNGNSCELGSGKDKHAIYSKNGGFTKDSSPAPLNFSQWDLSKLKHLCKLDVIIEFKGPVLSNKHSAHARHLLNKLDRD